jgi:hypothetical protein
MKYMLIMRTTDEGYAAYQDVPFEQVIDEMGAYNQALVSAGVLLAGEGLAEADTGFVVDFASTPPAVVDGPYGETKELFGGFWIIEVATRDEAVEWASRCPLRAGSSLEVRRVTEASDFPEGNETIAREEELRAEVDRQRAERADMA